MLVPKQPSTLEKLVRRQAVSCVAGRRRGHKRPGTGKRGDQRSPSLSPWDWLAGLSGLELGHDGRLYSPLHHPPLPRAFGAQLPGGGGRSLSCPGLCCCSGDRQSSADTCISLLWSFVFKVCCLIGRASFPLYLPISLCILLTLPGS